MHTVENFNDDWQKLIPQSIARSLKFAVFVLVVFFGLFVLWSVYVPIGGGIVSSGRIIAEGRNVVLNHLEGGIIREILAREGNSVVKGQVLIVLDTTASQAKLNQYSFDKTIARIKLTRLASEENDFTDIIIPEDLLRVADENAEVRNFLASQHNEFLAAKEEFQATINVKDKKIESLQEEISGYEKLIKSFEDQIVLLNEQITAQESLLEKGLTKQSIVLELRRAKTKLRGDIDSATADMNANKKKILELEAENKRFISEYRKNNLKEQVEQRQKIAEFEESINILKDVIERSEIRAPVDGKIVKIGVNAEKYVISPSDPILEILPSDVPLTIETNVRPGYIDQIEMDKDARVYFPGLEDKMSGSISGKVEYISPDAVYDKEERVYHYPVRVKIVHPSKELERLIYPGMTAEVHFASSSRTFFQMLVQPIARASRRAFSD